MANNLSEAILIQYLKSLNDQSTVDTSDPGTTVIQYFSAPYDKLSMTADVLSAAVVDPNATIVWGSSSVTAGWSWDDGGAYDAFAAITSQPSETLKLTAASTVTTFFPGDMVWGSNAITPNWLWGQGAYS